MQWHEFVFSKKPAYRLFRHFVFWAAWWIYFSLCQYLFQKSFSGERARLDETSYVTVGSLVLLKTFLLVLMDAAACYIFIYFLLPQFIKGKWLKPLVNTLLLGIFMFGAAWFMYWSVFPFVDSLFGQYKANFYFTQFWPAVYLGLIDPLKVVAAAAIITYVKYWWVKQKESERLEREKITAELQLLKAQMRPDLLFNSLDQIYKFAKKKSPEAPELLLKLADVLSYLLYECDESKVSLEKELNMMKEYMALEKARYGSRLELEIVIKGEVGNRQIAPLLLLPFIENSFKHCSNEAEQPWINLQISLEDETLLMKLINGVALGYKEPGNSVHEIINIEKRLQLLYPGKYELKRYVENEIYIVLLKINLGEGFRPEYPASKVINGPILKTDYAIR